MLGLFLPANTFFVDDGSPGVVVKKNPAKVPRSPVIHHTPAENSVVEPSTSNSNVNPSPALAPTKTPASASASPSASVAKKPEGGGDQGQGLSNEAISSTLAGHKEFMNRCYLRRESPTQTKGGLVKLSFVILNTGKTSEVKVTESQFKDEALHNCLMEVLGRVSFRPFTGKPITTQFPIRFTEQTGSN